MKYKNFLKTKEKKSLSFGFKTNLKFNKYLFEFQKYSVDLALKKGRFALFFECGLGKTICQAEWATHIIYKTKKPALILAPLAVSLQTIGEGKKFGIEIVKIKSYEDVAENKIYITNYENLDKLDPSVFSGIVLDESSILKSYMGKIKIKLIDSFCQTPYRLCCTATPSPNDFLEIGNHCQFLGIMNSNEMIARWFINDTMNFGNYRLKKHAEKNFWKWVSSWAICISKPSDLGFRQDGFDLPKLNMKEVQVSVDHSDNSTENLFRGYNKITAAELHKELKKTAKDRAKKVTEIVNNSNEKFIIWVNTNYEADEVKKVIPEAVEVRGSDKPELKEKRLLGFANNEFRILLTKPKIAQFGLNYQNCHNQIFMGLSYSFESLYQAIRRSYRFRQIHGVNCYLVIAETEGQVLKNILKKMKQHNALQKGLINSLQKDQIEILRSEKLINMPEKKIKKSNSWEMRLGDCIELIKDISDYEIDFTIFSPPFANLYIYSDSIRDMGNCNDDAEFMEHFDFLIKELYRVTRPGRLVAVHCKNLVNYKNRDGKAGIRDFRGEIIKYFLNQNFAFHSEVCIWKDPVIEMQRTKAHGLLYKQLRKDSSYSRQGLPDYLLMFRKWPENEAEIDLIKPVQAGNGGKDPKYNNYIGTDLPESEPDEKNHRYAIEVWQRYASPVWFDIQQTNCLNIKAARDEKDEKHICPLQLDVIERAVDLWTLPGDLVFSPFAGIGSEGYPTIKINRRFLGFELKEVYYESAIKNLMEAEQIAGQQELFK